MAGGETGLASWVDTTVSVITNDGKIIVGTLRGYDQATNLILDECHERVYYSKSGVQAHALGLYVVRGDNIAVVGEVDDQLDGQLDLSQIRAFPLKPVSH